MGIENKLCGGKDKCEIVISKRKKINEIERLLQEERIKSTKSQEDVETSLRVLSSISDFTDTKLLIKELSNNFIEITKSDYVTTLVINKKTGRFDNLYTNLSREDSKPIEDENVFRKLDSRFIEVYNTKDIKGLEKRKVKTKTIIVVPLYDRKGNKICIIIAESKKREYYKSREMEFCKIFANVSTLAVETALTYERLKDIAYIDTIIEGAYNKQYFDKIFDEIFIKNKRVEVPFILAMFDIDRFKLVNDTYGHIIGNEVIKKIGEIVLENIRKDDYFIRFGGDEMIIVFYNTIDLETIYKKVEDIKRKINSEVFYTENEKFSITCSFGVVDSRIFKEIEICTDDVVCTVDEGLYKSKNNGRDCITLTKEPIKRFIK